MCQRPPQNSNCTVEDRRGRSRARAQDAGRPVKFLSAPERLKLSLNKKLASKSPSKIFKIRNLGTPTAFRPKKLKGFLTTYFPCRQLSFHTLPSWSEAPALEFIWDETETDKGNYSMGEPLLNPIVQMVRHTYLGAAPRRAELLHGHAT